MQKLITRRYRVSGRVQGVSYRFSARTAALTLGLVGWVRNLPDDAVEAQATGTPAALHEFETWLWQGPPAARVTEVIVEELAFEAHDGFAIRH